MGKSTGEKKSLVEKVVDAVDQVIHPSPAQTTEQKDESSQEPKSDETAGSKDLQLMSKKKKTAPSENGELKKFDKFKRSEQ